MKVIAGLGNPGAQYANTPHSIGFEVVDAIACEIGAEWKASASFKGELATGMFAGQKVLLLKLIIHISGENSQTFFFFWLFTELLMHVWIFLFH